MSDPRQRKACVLVVEDENIVALDIERGLKRLGYDVPSVANNGRGAVQEAGELHPDLVLMDIQLQGDMDGIDAANEIRKRFNIPVVFLTAYADEATLQRAKVVEPYGYLLKPFEETELHTAIEVVLQKHKAVEARLATSEASFILSEERFKFFVESVKDYAIFMMDTAGNIISWNSGAEQTKGYRADEIIGKHFSIFYTNEDITKGRPEIELEVAANRGRYEEEGWRVRKDGTAIWADVVITALRDEKGVLRGYGKVVRDLSSKKRDQNALKESEARKTAILDASLDAILSMDHCGKITEFNTTAEKIFGHKRADVIGHDMSDTIIPRRLREAHRHGLNKYLASGEGPILGKRIEMPALRANGAEFPVELSIVAVKSGDDPIFTGFIRDISDLKQQERERSAMLAREELVRQRLAIQYNVMSVIAEATSLQDVAPKMLRLIAQNMRWDLGAFWVVDEETKRIRCAEVWSVPQLETGEFVETTRHSTLAVGEGLPGRVWQSAVPAWVKDMTFDDHFPRLRYAIKTGLHGALAFPLVSGKKILGAMEFYSLEVRSPDEELIQTVVTLGGQIGQFMNRLITEEELRRALGERDEFLSIASHELKTPLTTLSLQLQMFDRSLNTAMHGPDSGQDLLKKLPPEKIEKTVGICRTYAKKLSSLLDELLDLTRIRLGKLQLECQRVDLAQLTRDLVDRLSAGTETSPLFAVKAPAGAVTGTWDPTRLEQVITNLVTNAIKYGEGKPVEIEVSADMGRKHAILRVTDRGMGIPKELQGRIFERFERAVGPRQITGLGLGLYITRQIVEAHGGNITVQSEVGLGSTFVVILPLRSDEVAA